MFKKVGLILSSITILSGCILSPVKPININTYQIMPKIKTTANITPPEKFNQTLLMPPIISLAPFNSFSMYYAAKEYQLKPYAFNQWVALPGDMINNSVLFYLANNGPFSSTLYGGVISNAEYRINLVLNTLVLNLHTPNPMVTLNVSAQLTNTSNGLIVSKKNFNINMPSSASPDAFVISANKATKELAIRVHDWLSEQKLNTPTDKNK